MLPKHDREAGCKLAPEVDLPQQRAHGPDVVDAEGDEVELGLLGREGHDEFVGGEG